jgi:CubicO group peptidase (beta-lactamase class C family)
VTTRTLAAALALGATCAPAQTRSPAALDPARLAAVPRYLAAEVDSGAFPGAVVAVGQHGRLALLAAVGRYGQSDPRPVDSTTVYDLASLTKVVGLTTAVMLLARDRVIDLDAPVQRYVPAFQGRWKDRVTVRHLLTHSSGLPAWRPLYVEATTRAGAFALTDTTPLTAEPGARTIYSDLGAIVLTQVVESVAGERLDVFLERRVFRPLGLRSTRFRPPPDWRDRVAPTEQSADGTVIRGTVHDENAWRLGGVSGHAGLFSTAPDLALFAAWMLDAWHGRAMAGRPSLPPELVRRFTARQGVPPGPSRALGWDTPSEPSSAGSRPSALAFGHTGFTGTSLWLYPEHDLFVVLLTNRVHPTRENARITVVRPRVADLVMDALAPP